MANECRRRILTWGDSRDMYVDICIEVATNFLSLRTQFTERNCHWTWCRMGSPLILHWRTINSSIEFRPPDGWLFPSFCCFSCCLAIHIFVFSSCKLWSCRRCNVEVKTWFRGRLVGGGGKELITEGILFERLELSSEYCWIESLNHSLNFAESSEYIC